MLSMNHRLAILGSLDIVEIVSLLVTKNIWLPNHSYKKVQHLRTNELEVHSGIGSRWRKVAALSLHGYAMPVIFVCYKRRAREGIAGKRNISNLMNR